MKGVYNSEISLGNVLADVKCSDGTPAWKMSPGVADSVLMDPTLLVGALTTILVRDFGYDPLDERFQNVAPAVALRALNDAAHAFEARVFAAMDAFKIQVDDSLTQARPLPEPPVVPKHGCRCLCNHCAP